MSRCVFVWKFNKAEIFHIVSIFRSPSSLVACQIRKQRFRKLASLHMHFFTRNYYIHLKVVSTTIGNGDIIHSVMSDQYDTHWSINSQSTPYLPSSLDSIRSICWTMIDVSLGIWFQHRSSRFLTKQIFHNTNFILIRSEKRYYGPDETDVWLLTGSGISEWRGEDNLSAIDFHVWDRTFEFIRAKQWQGARFIALLLVRSLSIVNQYLNFSRH